MRFCLVILVLCATAAMRLGAQDFRATITGQVSDPSGAAITGAQIRAVQRNTNAVIVAVSNHQGYYTLPFLQPSTFDIEVTAQGFSKLRRENITLLVAEKLDLPLNLEVGSVMERMVVSASADVIQTADASLGLNFDSLQTSEYALNGRQVYMLMDLTPGVLFTQEQFGTSGYSGTRGWDTSGAYVMNGGAPTSNSFSLNGAPISLTGSWQVAPNVDAIQEFKVQTNTYDAAIGRTGGGSVNTALKSGSNAVHGTLFDFIRNSVFDANYTQNNLVGAPRGKNIRNQFGGTVGGAIRKDHDFVFFSFEGFRERVPFPVVASVPPIDLRDGQHFTKYNANIFDPLTVHDCVAKVDVATCSSPYIRDPFPGNVLPVSRLSAVGQKLITFFPTPNAAGVAQNFVAANSTGKYFYDQPMGRWDRVISERDRVYAMFTFQHGQEYRNQTGIPGAAASGNINNERTNFNIISSWTHILSPSAIFDLRASFGRFTQYAPDADLSTAITAKDLGMTNMIHAPTSNSEFPPRFITDQFANLFGNGSNLFTWSTSNQWNVVPTLTITSGKKTIRMGLDMVYASIGSGSIGQTNGQFNFDRSATRQYPLRGGTVSDGSGIADMLLGSPGSGFLDWNDTYYRSWPAIALFAQNDWKVSRKLTVNLGLRYDVQFPFVERWNRMNTGFDYKAVNPLSDRILSVWNANKAAYDANKANAFPFPPPPTAIYGGKTFIEPGASRRTYNTDWTNLQPRIGIAWAFAPRTVLRTGFGIVHRTAAQGGYTDGFSQQTAYQASLNGGINPSALAGASPSGPYSLVNPFPNGITAPTGRERGLLTNIGNAVSFDGRQRPIPRTFQYSFGLQRHMWWNVLLDASYVGSITNHDSLAYNSDYLPTDIFLQGQKTTTFLSRTVPNPFYGILPANSTFGASSTIAAQNLFYPYPLFNGITISTNPWAKIRYDSLQLSAQKRFGGNRNVSGALTMVFSYTFAKNMQSSNRLNNWNLAEDPVHELVSYDKPQNISYSGVWDIPFGKGRHFLPKPNKFVHQVISGWNVNWIYRFTSGNPVAGIDALSNCADLVVENQTKDRWFNNDKSCNYRSRASYTLRVVPDRYARLRQMDNLSVNLAVGKTFAVTERWKFNLRGEAFNLMNHPIYKAPDTSITSVRFGMLPLDQQNFPRVMQVSAKLIF